MRAVSSVGIGWGLISACLFLALVAELYYLFWWKKRRTSRDLEDSYMRPSMDFLDLLCCKKPSFLSSTPLHPRAIPAPINGADPGRDDSKSNAELLLKPFVDHQDAMEVELVMLAGPPKVLFTINEETKEDLESDGGRSRKGSRGKSLSDLLLSPDTPFLTPLPSPPLPASSVINPLDYISQNGFNPLFECSRGEDLSKMWTSPPPTFKFLRDAEEKLFRKVLTEEARKVQRHGVMEEMAKREGTVPPANAALPLACPQHGDGSFIAINTVKNRDSNSSQLIPLPSPSSAATDPRD